MTGIHIETGKIGEKEGTNYLKKLGYKLLKQNFRCPLGEIDCIAKDKDTLVFIEIKTRREPAYYGFPEESVDWRKQRKMTKVAQYYLKRVNRLDAPSRFDVLSISIRNDGHFDINHIQNAFEIESKENT